MTLTPRLIRVCGTVITDEEIVASEKYFQENKVIPGEFAVDTVLNVHIISHHSVWLCSTFFYRSDLFPCY
jgi:hypothetical protein